MNDSGSTGLAEIAALIGQCQFVDVRLALVKVAEDWQVRHGEVTLHAAAAPKARAWRYAAEVFLERRVPGAVAAGLLRAEAQDLDGLKVTAPAPLGDGTFQRIAAHSDWRPTRMPWPRTQWEISAAQPPSSRQGGLLVGDGPSYVSYEAAFSAFFLAAPPSNQANQQPLWRVIRLDRRAWLHRVAVASDAVEVTVKGTTLDGVNLELSTPTDRIVRPVGRSGRLKVRLRQGLAEGSLLLLRHGGEWLDFRYFTPAGPGRQQDPSVIWHQPEAELALLVAGGEGQYVEFKREVPKTSESRRTVLKTIAAFASGDGGTVLFGVADDAQVVGVDPAALDGLMLAVGNMIRDSIDPEPRFRLRAAELDGRTLLLAEMNGGGQWYTLNPARPEFYVRRGASTPPARKHEIAAGFGQPSPHLAW
ncbi:MAG: hypothetical protein V7603_5166 [Micromonosporaceae bacterium]